MKTTFFSLCALGAVTITTQAASIGINFGAGRPGASIATTATAGVVPQQYWNNASGASGTIASLTNESNGASGASVTWATDEQWSNGSPTTPDGQLLLGWISENPGGVDSTIDITGISYPLYDLYVYMHHDRAVEDTILGETGGAFSNFTLVETDDDGGGIEDLVAPVVFTQQTASDGTPGNYAVFSGLSAANLNLTLGVGRGQRAPINGIQVVQVPEPSTGILALLAVFGLVARRR